MVVRAEIVTGEKSGAALSAEADLPVVRSGVLRALKRNAAYVGAA
jgi:hypothetical protein